jgi:hypothetical protein
MTNDGFRHDVVVPDLVAYLVVVVPDLTAVADLAPPLSQLVANGSLRILDLVVVRSDPDGGVEVLELGDVEELSGFDVLATELPGLLTDHDIALAALALRPDTAGVVVLAEDQWAEPLSAAARRVGGQIVGGERISASRIEAALRTASEPDPGA